MTRKLNLLASLFMAVFLSACAGMETKTNVATTKAPEKEATVVVSKNDAPAVVVRTRIAVREGKYSLKDCTGAPKNTAGYLCWRKVGGDPYIGNAEQALAQSGWPTEVKKALLVNFEKKVGAEMTLKRGDTFDWMAFGRLLKGNKAKVRVNTVAAWAEGEEHIADVYSTSFKGVEYKLFRVRDCGNFAGFVIRAAETLAEVPEEPPVPQSPPKETKIVKAPESEWYRKSRVVMREVITETPVAVASSGCYDGCGGYVGFSGWVGNSGAVIGAPYVVQPAQAYIAGPTITGRTLPPSSTAPVLTGRTLPPSSSGPTISGRTLPQSSFSGRTLPQTSFSGRTL